MKRLVLFHFISFCHSDCLFNGGERQAILTSLCDNPSLHVIIYITHELNTLTGEAYSGSHEEVLVGNWT